MDDSYGSITAGLLIGLDVQVEDLEDIELEDYSRYYEQYVSDTKESIDTIKRIWKDHPTTCEKQMEDVAKMLLSEVQGEISENISSWRQEDHVEFIDHYRNVIGLYLIPLLKDIDKDFSNCLAEKFYEKWVEEFPSGAFEMLSYEQIADEGRNPFTCYITESIYKVLNRNDDYDCYELSAFRQFRDDYLLGQPEGRELVRKYYETSPKITSKIDALPNAEQVYCQIWEDYLSLCLEEIEESEYEECKRRCIRMHRNILELVEGA
ncbi:hypothetical protein P261_00851 [Lachnospiraceae bacterium TWA4]|nr:hypothetical protein P261_00851 [Lachnospiraceae bacterium TWA4]